MTNKRLRLSLVADLGRRTWGIAPALACLLWTFQAVGAPTAILATSGSQVLVNGAVTRNGTAIRSRDTLSTGPKSSARVVWSDGTRLQLDENTVPKAGCEAWTIGIHVGCGWFLIETGKSDVSITTSANLNMAATELVKVRAPSRLAVHVERGSQFELYLLDGHVTLLGAPSKVEMKPNDTVLVRQGTDRYGKQSRRSGTITPDQNAQIGRRFSRWKFAH